MPPRHAFGVGLLVLLSAAVPAPAQTVYAAASLATALQEATDLLPGRDVRLSFASSSSLAKQIAAGAPVDIYFSANTRWMDYLQDRGLIAADTRVDLLANSLVVIAPEGESFEAIPEAGFDFAGSFPGRLAVGDPSHVPAGIYARQALVNLGWFAALADRLAPAPDARAALVYVERGECAAGIVYATDAAASARVEVLAPLPAHTHDPIVYPVAATTAGESDSVRDLLAFFQSPQAAAVFRRHGFMTRDAGSAVAAAGADTTTCRCRTGP